MWYTFRSLYLKEKNMSALKQQNDISESEVAIGQIVSNSNAKTINLPMQEKESVNVSQPVRSN